MEPGNNEQDARAVGSRATRAERKVFRGRSAAADRLNVEQPPADNGYIPVPAGSDSAAGGAI
jgi:hypothetical protein